MIYIGLTEHAHHKCHIPPLQIHIKIPYIDKINYVKCQLQKSNLILVYI